MKRISAMRKRLTQSTWSRISLAWALALMTATAFPAQVGAASREIDPPGTERKLKLEELKRQKNFEDAYRAAIKKIPNQKPKDPWGDIRSSSPTVPAPKTK